MEEDPIQWRVGEKSWTHDVGDFSELDGGEGRKTVDLARGGIKGEVDAIRKRSCLKEKVGGRVNARLKVGLSSERERGMSRKKGDRSKNKKMGGKESL